MKKLTFKNKLGYFLGDFGNCMSFAMSSSFLLMFYTNVVGITAAAAGTLFFVARIWDAFTDPMMGVLCDKIFAKRLAKYKGKADKFRPFLLSGSFLVVASAILMFFVPGSLSAGQKLAWAYATYILWGMCYTYINIPYGSLASVMTQDPAERASLSVARGLGGTLGNMIPRMVVPMILSAFATNQAKGYLVAMTVLGAVGLVSYLITYATVEEHVKMAVVENDPSQKVGIITYLKLLSKNRPFIAVCIASLGMLFGMMMNMSMMAYYFSDNLNNMRAMGIATVISMLPGILLAPFLSRLVRRFYVKKVVSVSSLLAAISYAAILFFPSNLWIYIVLSGIGGLFMNIPSTLVYGMVSDCIDYNQYICGERQEGAIYGSYSFVRKMGQALAGLIGGAGLTIVGYQAGAAQSASTLFGIKFLTVGAPAIGLIIAYIGFRFIWNLTPEKQEEVFAAISQKN